MTHHDEQSEDTVRLGGRTFTRRAAMIVAPIAVIGLAAGAYATMVATAPKPDKTDKPPPPLAVQIATVESRAARLSVSVQGQATPRNQASLAAQVAGRIVWTSPAFVEGGAFRRGEALVKIEDADYQLAFIRAQSQVAQAQEVLAREEAEAELARRDWEVLGQGDASALTLREPQLAQVRAALAAAEAQLQSAQLDLDRTSIRAPFDGRVMKRRSTLGAYVGPSVAVADVFATDVMEIRVPLTNADLQTLQVPIGFLETTATPGRPSRVEAAVGGRSGAWEGRLVRTEATVDPQTRLVYGVVEVRNPFGAELASPLAPGLFVTTHIEGGAQQTLLAAPRSALKRNEFVYVVNAADEIEIRQVQAAQTSGDEVFFQTGVKAGDRLVVSPLPTPREGMKVTPMAHSSASLTSAK
jgi:RND family efflux transporter MFP subunit